MYKQYKDESLEIIDNIIRDSNISEYNRGEIMSIVRNSKEQNEGIIKDFSENIEKLFNSNNIKAKEIKKLRYIILIQPIVITVVILLIGVLG